jgi:hypothetical protein
MVFGPPLHNISSLDALNTSSGAVYTLMKPDGSSSKEVPETAFPAVSRAWALLFNQVVRLTLLTPAL